MIPRRVVICLTAVALIWPARTLADEEPPTNGPGDCGTLALYHLLHLEGRPTDFSQLESMLGVPTAEGHSLRELREAASRFGLKLDAVVLPKRQPTIQGPALVFVKNDRWGHFIVVRPVGHTGRLIQVLDGERLPIVTDAEWLFASSAWTGLALVPHRLNSIVMAGLSVACACMIALVLRLFARTQGSFLLKVTEVGQGITGGREKRSRLTRDTLETPP
jgi:Peptidase C39 family